jgi:DNA-binding NarL/FixJ family response regulator
VHVVIAEDLFLLREGMASLLKEHGFDIAEAVGDGPSLLRALIELRTDVAVVDVRLPPAHTDEGLRAALEARRQVPGLPVLILSTHVERLYARELLADHAGGVGYLLKDRVFTDEQFTDAGGRSNSAIAQRLVVSEKAVSKHCTSIFAKLDLPPSDDDNRRVLAVLAYLDA